MSGLLWWSLSVAAAGSTRLAALCDYDRAEEQLDHARRAAHVGARLPNKPSRGAANRALAWQVVGRLRVDDAGVVDDAIRAYSAAQNPPAVRVAAAFAMGETGRSLPWDARSKALTDALVASMSTDLDADTAYAAVEALGKVYPQHAHSLDEDLAVARGLNALAARQTTQLPGVYYVVQQRILSLEVAVRLLADVVAAAERDPSPVAQAEAYSGALSMVRWLGGRQEQLAAGFGDRRVQISTAFDGLSRALALKDRRIVLMVAWSLGEIAREPVFADLVAEELAPFAADADPAVRMIVAGSLAHLDAAAPARVALRDAILAREPDDRVLRLLAALTADPAAADVAQRVHDVAIKP